MSKHIVLLLLGFLVVLVKCEEAASESQRPSLSHESNDNDEEDEVNVNAVLMNAIRRGLLAEMLLKQRLNERLAASSDASDESASSEELTFKEKRYPRWRTGETRSKVKQLHKNIDHYPPNDPLLRKIWEKNMLEKNKLYQTLLG